METSNRYTPLDFFRNVREIGFTPAFALDLRATHLSGDSLKAYVEKITSRAGFSEVHAQRVGELASGAHFVVTLPVVGSATAVIYSFASTAYKLSRRQGEEVF